MHSCCACVKAYFQYTIDCGFQRIQENQDNMMRLLQVV